MKRSIHDKNQRGAALLVLILIIVAGSAWMLLENLNATAIQNERDEHDALVLAQAKQALIAYALTHSDLDTSGEFGFLPCPDTFGGGAIDEGGSDGACGSRYQNSLGRLPWRTLGLSPLKDASGSCLWYAVSGSYKNGAQQAEMLNADTNGSFEIYSSEQGKMIAGAQGGSGYEERPVAVIFAPGDPVPDQDRSETSPTDTPECGGNYNADNYLESLNIPTVGLVDNSNINKTDDIDNIVSGVFGDGSKFNDKIVYITKQDIWNTIKDRNDFAGSPSYNQRNDFFELTDNYSDTDIDNMMFWISACLAKYGNNASGGSVNEHSLPFPAPVDYADYRTDSAYDDRDSSGSRLSGRLPDVIDDSNAITGKSGNLITDCDLTNNAPNDINTITASENAKFRRMWENWKDHVFYIVADVYKPGGANWNCSTWFNPLCAVCGNGQRCVRLMDDSGNYMEDFSAMVIFGQDKLEGIGQSRLSPPIDVNDSNDEKGVTQNYLEEPESPLYGDNINAFNNYNDSVGDDNIDIYNYDPSSNFNDVIYCLNDDDSGTDTHHEIRRCQTSN